MRRTDYGNDREMLHELDQMQSREPMPAIEPPGLVDQAVRNMARRELQNPARIPVAGKLRWIAGLSTVSIALIALGISLVQSPQPPHPAEPALMDAAKSRHAESGSAMPAAAPAHDEDAIQPQLKLKEQQAEPRLESFSSAELGKTERDSSAAIMNEEESLSAQAWLDLIRQLYDQGLRVEAAEQLKAFSTDYPGYPLPEWALELQQSQD
ncbi:MAG TPA: hypothetical protein VFG52_09075 [Xanthomonadales bacterium]|nr:hypothetical protein [Xanthomonadales bacterium]